MIRRQPGPLLVAIVMAMLALRLWLPVGWMPVATADGPVLALCSGTANPADGPSGTADGKPCDFALSAQPMLAGAALLVPLLALWWQALARPLPPAPVPASARRRWRPPAHGPPRS